MDPKEWLAYEEKCIQEQPPACVAGCPIHMDARSFLMHMKAGNVNKAYDVYRKTVPFPEIVGRVCDHPCQLGCNRREVGEAIEIGAVERACVNAKTSAPLKLVMAPRKKQRIAIVGAGISGLTGALDLAKKGYHVVVFERSGRLGGALWTLSDDVLPKQFLEDEFAVLSRLGVEFELETSVGTSGSSRSLNELQRDFDAVYVSVGAAAEPVLGLDYTSDGRPQIDEATFATNLPGVFAGGGMRQGLTHGSFILALSDGRRAATSIDRFLQGVSMTAVRDNEGPYETSLYTSTEGTQPSAVVQAADAKNGYTVAEAMAEASRCLDCQCLECVKNCEFLSHYRSYPKKYARQINQNLRIVMGIHGANTMINSCSLCGLCKEVCPTGFDMSKLILEARTEMVAKGKMPPSAHDFPLQEMSFRNSEQCTFTRNQPGLTSSAYVLFPGCSLSSSAPEHVERIYDYLMDNLDGGVGLMSRCCGAPAASAGRTELFADSLAEIRRRWNDMGRPKFVVACSSCYQVFKGHLPEVELVSLWELYQQFGLPTRGESHHSWNSVIQDSTLATVGHGPTVDREPTATDEHGEPRDEPVLAQVVEQGGPKSAAQIVAVHDACTTRYESQIHDSVRSILSTLGYEIEELPNHRTRTECCGAGGLMRYANRPLSEATAARRARQSARDFITYCYTCRDTFVNAGKSTHHILDLIYGQTALAQLDRQPTKRPYGYSQQRHNLVSLKKHLLEKFWGEVVDVTDEPHQSIQLFISEELDKVMEDRLIPYEDVQKVIEYAERTGHKVLNRNNGHILASYKPVNVTYWVEYTPEDMGYLIHNAYSHRMTVE